MKIAALIVAVAGLAFAPHAMAVDDAAAKTTQGCKDAANAKKLVGADAESYVTKCVADAGTNKANLNTVIPAEKKNSCNASASAQKMKGEDRQVFLGKCYATKEAGGISKASVSDELIAGCKAAADAKQIKGADRNAFLIECGKTDGASAK